MSFPACKGKKDVLNVFCGIGPKKAVSSRPSGGLTVAAPDIDSPAKDFQPDCRTAARLLSRWAFIRKARHLRHVPGRQYLRQAPRQGLPAGQSPAFPFLAHLFSSVLPSGKPFFGLLLSLPMPVLPVLSGRFRPLPPLDKKIRLCYHKNKAICKLLFTKEALLCWIIKKASCFPRRKNGG